MGQQSLSIAAQLTIAAAAMPAVRATMLLEFLVAMMQAAAFFVDTAVTGERGLLNGFGLS